MRALALVLPVLLLAACGDPTVVTPVPTPTVTPVFASDEEALAAAEEAYARYLAVDDAITADAGQRPDRIENITTAAEYERAVTQYAAFASSGRRTVGQSTFDSMTVQRQDPVGVVVYVCLDVSAIRLLDATGNDVTSPSRIDRLPLEVVFEVVDERLLLDSSDIWDGDNFCEH